MGRRTNAEKIERVFCESDRDLAKALTIARFCRKHVQFGRHAVPREGLIGASALGGFRQRSYLLPELAKDGDRPSKPLLSQAREELVHGPGRLLHAIPFVLGGREGGIEEQQATTNNVLASESLPMIAEAEVDTPCAAPGPEPLRAVHTSNLPELLQRIDASLLVTTYQAGKLVMVRNEGGRLNAHFRTFQAPMG
jgi:hypothetical protein